MKHRRGFITDILYIIAVYYFFYDEKKRSVPLFILLLLVLLFLTYFVAASFTKNTLFSAEMMCYLLRVCFFVLVGL